MILDYMKMLGFYLIFSAPFYFILNVAFNILQIPFALISRAAVFCVLSLRTYFCALYFAVCTAACISSGYSAIPFLIFFSITLYTSFASCLRDAKDSSESTYFLISAFLVVPAFIAMSLVPFLTGYTIIAKYLDLCSWVLTLPIIGDILNFLLPFFSVAVMFWACVTLFFGYLALILEAIGRLKKFFT